MDAPPSSNLSEDCISEVSVVCDGGTLPALFWDGNEDWVSEAACADYAALHSLKFDETTAIERAESYKSAGNSALKFKQNKAYLRKAVQQYTLALLENVENKELLSVLHSNRAQAALLLGNHRKALIDSEMAIKINPGNLKGWFRAAKSAFGLGNLQQCMDFCQKGLLLANEQTELLSLLETTRAALSKAEEQVIRDKHVQVEIKLYIEEVLIRNLVFGPPILGTQERFPEFSKDRSSFLHWVLFVYPEYSQTDVIKCFDENTPFHEHLDYMFSDANCPLVWDKEGVYTRESLELYYQANAVQAYSIDFLENILLEQSGVYQKYDFIQGDGHQFNDALIDPRDKYFVRVKEDTTLKQVLAAEDHVIPGHPVIYIVSQDSEFKIRFLAGNWEL